MHVNLRNGGLIDYRYTRFLQCDIVFQCEGLCRSKCLHSELNIIVYIFVVGQIIECLDAFYDGRNRGCLDAHCARTYQTTLSTGIVIEITSPNQYKIKLEDGIILPKSEWYDPTDKKHAAKPWHIHEYIGCNELDKTRLNSGITKDTLDKNELKNAIKKQKNFIRGKVKK